MAIRMRQTVKTANGVYEGGDIITGLSPVLEAQLIDGGSAIWVPGDVSSVSGDGSADLLAFLANANDNGSRYIATDYVAGGYVF